MFFPNPILIIRIVEYSTISVQEYFKDTLANMGLPGAWLKYDLNCVTCVENKYVRRESNWIRKKPSESSQIKTTIEYNQIETTIASNQIKSCEFNQDKNCDQQNCWY